MVDVTFLATLAIVVVGVLIGGYLNAQQKDRCLADFEGYQVTLEKLDGRLIWGKMNLESTGIELTYSSDVQDEHHIETSYILYKDEFPHIQAIYRYCDEMDQKQQARRQRDLNRSFHPGLWRRFRRHFRNFMSLTSDSLGQALGILIGQAKAPAGRFITDASEKYLNQLGKNVIGYVGTRYDPLLEKYVGTKVVVEVTEEGVVYEHVGILKEYSADFLEVLDVHYPKPAVVQVAGEKQDVQDKNLRLVREGNELKVGNVGAYSLLLQSLRIGDQVKPLNAVLDKGDEVLLHLPEGTAGGKTEVQLEVKVVRYLDWILPRAHALIRHKAERYDPDRVFNIGFMLRLEGRAEEEERLRQVLLENPEDASSAVQLGQILFQRGKINEAEHWFCYALGYKSRLPDGGKLAMSQLRYIQDKKARLKSTAHQASCLESYTVDVS